MTTPTTTGFTPGSPPRVGGGNDINGNQIGTQSTPIDPKLGALQNNGGKTFTHALLNTSPAIDAGNNLLGCIGKSATL